MAPEGEEPADASSGPRMTVLLVNQSSSMTKELEDYGISMAEGVADVLNLYLQKVTQKRDEDRRKGGSEFDSANFGILVIGYGARGAMAERVFQMDQGETWANETMTRSQSATTSSDEALSTFSIWIDGVAGSPQASLSEAIDVAADFLEAWVASHRLAPAPYVVSLTDGTFTGPDPRKAVERLTSLSTLNGKTVVWTCQLTTDRGRKPVLFPNDAGLLGPATASSALFQATSGFPTEAVSNLMMEFPEVSKLEGAKAAVFDADLRTLVRFLAFVTRVPLP